MTSMTEKPMFLVDKSKNLIGACTHGIDGWRFIPNNAAHKASRKAWETPNACIPRWAFDASDDLLTLDEWKKERAA